MKSRLMDWRGLPFFVLGVGLGRRGGQSKEFLSFFTCTSLQIGIHLFHMNVWSVNTTLQRGACAKVEFHFAYRCMCNGCAWAMGECDFAKRGMCNGWMLLCKDAQMVTAILQRGTMCSGWTLLCKKAHMQTVNATFRHLLYRKVLGE